MHPDWASKSLKAREALPPEDFPPTGGGARASQASPSPLSPRVRDDEGGGGGGGIAPADGGGTGELVAAATTPPPEEEEERPYLGRMRAKLACQQRSRDPPKGVNLNAHITDKLEDLAEIYDKVLGDPYKAKNHNLAANAIKDLPFKATRIEQLVDPPVIPAMASKRSTVRGKINEILTTGRLQKLEELKRNDRVVAVRELTRVWGVGEAKARHLFNVGIKTVNQLRARVHDDVTPSGGEGEGPGTSGALLTSQQMIGLKYFDEFDQRMPREEASAIAGYVERAARRACPGCVAVAAGSYRRGKPTCGDLDVLISPTREWMTAESCGSLGDGRGGVSTFKDILPTVLAELRGKGVLTDDLSVGKDSYMGVALLPSEDAASLQLARADADADGGGGMGVVPVEPARTHRRIDVKVYAPEELPFALLYFTGSGYFNRSMRYWAKRRFGLSLNDKGIFRETSNAASKVTDAEIDDEADVFEYLRLKYVAPEDRSV